MGLRAGAQRERVPPEAQRLIDRLNRDFGNLREVLQGPDPSLAEALLDPVVERFTEALASVAAARPDLAPQCESLTEDLSRLLDPLPWEPMGDSGDAEDPF